MIRSCPSTVRRAAALALLLATLAGCGGGASESTTPPARRTVSVLVDSPLAAGESFGFGLGSQTVTVAQTNAAASFGTGVDEGSSYTVAQLSGPRTCSLSANRSGTAGAQNITVVASCGNPPAPRTVRVRVDTALATGESFGFTLGTQVVTVTQSASAVAFATPLPEGSAYAVAQSAGPRSCTLSANASGTLGAADVLVTAQCGSPAASSLLSGELLGPPGSQVQLRLNGGEEITPLIPAQPGGALYGTLPFSFTQPLPDGTAYSIQAALLSQGHTCVLLRGDTGTLPAAAGALRVGCEHTHEHVSRSANARGTVSTSTEPVLGGTGRNEGRYVAFTSTDANLAGATGGSRQVFWRDRLTGQVRMVSTDGAGAPGNNSSDAPALSADGQTVVFQSTASNLVAGDTNGVSDVFAWQAGSGTVQRLSVGDGGVQSNAGSFAPTVSGDGRVVAFATGASNLTTGVTGTATRHIVRRDRSTGTNLLVSRASGGSNAANASSGWPVLSEDGNRLAFWSIATDLVSGDTNNLWDIFVHQHDTAQLRRVSLTATGGERNGGTESGNRNVLPAISGNGRYVAYATTASNVVAGDTNNAQDLFIVDLDAPSGLGVQRVEGSNGTQGNADTPKGQGERVALSHDGTWVAFTTAASTFGAAGDNVILLNWPTGTLSLASPGVGTVYPPAISRTAAYVAFAAGRALDPRFSETGLFAHYTGITEAWYWRD